MPGSILKDNLEREKWTRQQLPAGPQLGLSHQQSEGESPAWPGGFRALSGHDRGLLEEFTARPVALSRAVALSGYQALDCREARHSQSASSGKEGMEGERGAGQS